MVATVTLDRLLEGIDVVSPDALNISGPTKKRRDKGYDRADLVGLQTTASQRRFYGQRLAAYYEAHGRTNELENKAKPGELEWHHNYVRFGELEEIAKQEKVGYQKLLDAVRARLGNSRFIRFQLIFSHEHQLAFPRELIMEDIIPDLKGGSGKGWKRIGDKPLVACLVSPDRLSDNFAIRLGLIDSNKGDRPITRYRKKADLKAINGLKLMFQSAVSLHKENGNKYKDNRVLVVQPAKESDRAMFPGAVAIDPSHHGSVLFIRELPNPDSRKKFQLLRHQLMVQYFPSAYGARRKTERESVIHRREVRKLAEVVTDLGELNQRLNVDWKNANATERAALCRQARTLFRNALRLLQHCENRYKVETRDLIAAINVGKAELRDSKNRPNVAPCMTRVASGKRRLEKRLDEISSISGYNRTDQVLIQDAIAQHERIIERFGDRMLVELTSARGKQRFDNSFTQRARPITAQSILGSTARSLDAIWLRPFTVYTKPLLDSYAKLEVALQDKDKTAAEEALIKIHVTKKFLGVMKLFEGIKEKVLFPEDIQLDGLYDFISRLRSNFETYQIFPDHMVKGYVDPFEKLKIALQKLSSGIAHYKVQDLSAKDREKMFKRLKKFLETFDIEEMVKDLN